MLLPAVLSRVHCSMVGNGRANEILYYLITVSLVDDFRLALFGLSLLTMYSSPCTRCGATVCVVRRLLLDFLTDADAGRPSLGMPLPDGGHFFVCPYLPMSDRSRWIVAVLRILVAALTLSSTL